MSEYSLPDERRNVNSLLKERLGQDLLGILKRISQIADRCEIPVFAVGGFVRDLLLNIPNKDIDIVVECQLMGSANDFASKLAEDFDGKVKSHQKFGTSVVTFPDGYRIDVAMARGETYEYPAALPQVKASSLDTDSGRRDFTINSLAIKLNGKGAFCLIDFFNG